MIEDHGVALLPLSSKIGVARLGVPRIEWTPYRFTDPIVLSLVAALVIMTAASRAYSRLGARRVTLIAKIMCPQGQTCS